MSKSKDEQKEQSVATKRSKLIIEKLAEEQKRYQQQRDEFIDSVLDNEIEYNKSGNKNTIINFIPHFGTINHSNVLVSSIEDSAVTDEIVSLISEIRQVKESLVQVIPVEESIDRVFTLRRITGSKTLNQKDIVVAPKKIDRKEIKHENKEEINENKNSNNWNNEKFNKVLKNISKISLHLPIGIGFDYLTETPLKENIFLERLEKEQSLIDALSSLDQLEREIVNSKNESIENITRKFLTIKHRVDIQLNRISSYFNQVIHSATYYSNLLQTIVQKIGYSDYKEEAKMHLSVVNSLEAVAKLTELQKSAPEILNAEVSGILGVLTELEIRRIKVESLYDKDSSKQGKNDWAIIIYSLVVVIGLWCLISFNIITPYLPINNTFISVVIWAAIGSFASILYRYNKIPTYDFGSTIKWLITRPIQGIVLGAAIYLVLVSGEYFFTGKTNSFDDGHVVIIYFISFLLGFSDKFTENSFDALIDKYSYVNKNKTD